MAKHDNTDSTDNLSSSSSSSSSPSFVEKMKLMCSNAKNSTGLCCFKMKKRTEISALELRILQLKKKFGVEYLTLVGEKASASDLKKCLKKSVDEVADLQEEIEDHLHQIAGEEHNNKMTKTTKMSDETLVKSDAANTRTNNSSRPSSKSKKTPIIEDDIEDIDIDDDDNAIISSDENGKREDRKSSSKKKRKKPKGKEKFTIEQ